MVVLGLAQTYKPKDQTFYLYVISIVCARMVGPKSTLDSNTKVK